MEWLSDAVFEYLFCFLVFTSLKVGEYGLLCFIASRGWFEVTGETENLLDGTFSRQQKVTLDSRLGPFDTLFYWATSAAFTCCPSVQKIFWNSYYTSLLSIHSRDVQNANQLGLDFILDTKNDPKPPINQRPKNLGGKVALPSGNFLRVWKVLARNPWNCNGEFLDPLENFQIVWIFSGLSEIFGIAWKVSR